MAYQSLDIFADNVGLDIDLYTWAGFLQGRDGMGVRNDTELKGRTGDTVYGQTDAIYRNRTLFNQVARCLVRHLNIYNNCIMTGADLLNRSDRIDVPGYNMTTKAITDPQGAFEVNPASER